MPRLGVLKKRTKLCNAEQVDRGAARKETPWESSIRMQWNGGGERQYFRGRKENTSKKAKKTMLGGTKH